MTRNDFELIARAISRTRDATLANADPLAVPDEATRFELFALDAVAENIATTLAGTNSRFDRPRFLDACGVPR